MIVSPFRFCLSGSLFSRGIPDYPRYRPERSGRYRLAETPNLNIGYHFVYRNVDFSDNLVRLGLFSLRCVHRRYVVPLVPVVPLGIVRMLVASPYLDLGIHGFVSPMRAVA